MRRVAHAHAGESWKCQRVDVPRHSVDDGDDEDAAAAAAGGGGGGGTESWTSPSPDVRHHRRVIDNFTGLTHRLHAWHARSLSLSLSYTHTTS